MVTQLILKKLKNISENKLIEKDHESIVKIVDENLSMCNAKLNDNILGQLNIINFKDNVIFVNCLQNPFVSHRLNLITSEIPKILILSINLQCNLQICSMSLMNASELKCWSLS